MNSELAKYTLATLTYYDVMDYPMTPFEIWKYLTRITNDGPESAEEYSLAEILNELESDKLKKFIENHDGYYFLRGRRFLIEQRLERNKISERKIKIVRKIVWWLRFVPYIRMVAVTGSLASKNSERKSDLDLLVVLESGKIFTGRTLVTLLVHLLGKRRYGNKISDRICLNFFITLNSLEINLKDAFSSSEYSFILPVFGFDNFRKFQAENGWIKKYKVNYQPEEIANLKLVEDAGYSRIIRRAGEKIFSAEFIEENLKGWQTGRIMRDPRTHEKGSMIVADSDALVFLPDPQSPKIFEQFKDRLAGLK